MTWDDADFDSADPLVRYNAHQAAKGRTQMPDPDEVRKNDRERGLYRKYHVDRLDGNDSPGDKHHGCVYFVLDLTHDPFAWDAALAYAAACNVEYPILARELRLIAARAAATGHLSRD